MSREYGAFSEDEVSSLTGLTKRQLGYWDTEVFFSPEYEVDGKRVYSFRDLVALRAIAPIRKRLSLQSLRRISAFLESQYESPWATLRFYFAGDKELVYIEPDSRDISSATTPGQQVMEIDLEEISRRTIAVLNESQRRRDQIGTVVRMKDVMRNSPVIAGTRVTTRAIADFHNAGYSIEEILGEYPGITREDAEAAISWEENRMAG